MSRDKVGQKFAMRFGTSQHKRNTRLIFVTSIKVQVFTGSYPQPKAVIHKPNHQPEPRPKPLTLCYGAEVFSDNLHNHLFVRGRERTRFRVGEQQAASGHLLCAELMKSRIGLSEPDLDAV